MDGWKQKQLDYPPAELGNNVLGQKRQTSNVSTLIVETKHGSIRFMPRDDIMEDIQPLLFCSSPPFWTSFKTLASHYTNLPAPIERRRASDESN